MDRRSQHLPVSIVIPHYGDSALTAACLSAVAAHTPHAHEVIVVDNGTGDLFDVRTLRNDENLGFAVACNQGFRAAAHDLVLFLNNDTAPLPGWLDPLVAAMDNPRVGAVSPGETTFDGVDRDWLPRLHANYRGTMFSVPEYRALIPPGEASLVPAFALLVRRDAFLEAGGFDERYWNGHEDIDLLLELKRRGWVLWFEPRSRVKHHGSASSEPERFARASANRDRLTSKWTGKVEPDVILARPPLRERSLLLVKAVAQRAQLLARRRVRRS